MHRKVLGTLIYGSGFLGGLAMAGGLTPLRFAVLVVAPLVIVLSFSLMVVASKTTDPRWNTEERAVARGLYRFFRENWSGEGEVELSVPEAFVTYRLLADQMERMGDER